MGGSPPGWRVFAGFFKYDNVCSVPLREKVSNPRDCSTRFGNPSDFSTLRTFAIVVTEKTFLGAIGLRTSDLKILWRYDGDFNFFNVILVRVCAFISGSEDESAGVILEKRDSRRFGWMALAILQTKQWSKEIVEVSEVQNRCFPKGESGSPYNFWYG